MLTVRVRGADAAAARIAALARDLDDASGTHEVARLAVRNLARFAPRRTGRLARSFRADGPDAGSPLVYAPIVNWGSRYMTGRRFAERAAAQTESAANRIIAAAVAADIDRRGLA